MEKRQGSNKKLNNSGMTLVELIIVVAIISTMTGALILSTDIVRKSRLTNAFNKLQSAYSLSRTNSMSKNATSDLVLRFDGKYYYCQSGDEEEEKMGIANYSMKFVVYDESTNKETTYASFEKMAEAYGNKTARTITIRFTRSGKLEPLKDGDDVYLSQIWLDSKVMYITYETGKYSLEK